MKRFVIAALALVIGAGSVLSFSPVADAMEHNNSKMCEISLKNFYT